MKVLVCGGRDYDDWSRVRSVLDHLSPVDGNGITHVIHGGADGADALAARWAIERDITCSTYFADWAKHGRAAGPIRNGEMLTKGAPDVVVAFPGGRGTADMVRRSRAAGVRVIEVTATDKRSAGT